MTDQSRSVRSGREVSKKEAREQRILDAAAELFQKWGYRKTTLADIAKQARVAKGTIYQSWKTREELLMALLNREEARLLVDIEQRMAADPDGMALPNVIKHSTLAILKNPWMKAVILQDTEVLGDLATSAYSMELYQTSFQRYTALLEFLRNHDLIRKDVDLRQQVLMLTAVSWGFMVMNPLLPDEFRFSDEDTVEIMTKTLKRLLEPDVPPSEEQIREGQKAMQDYLELRRTLNQEISHEIAAKS